MAVRNWSRKSIEDVIRAVYDQWKKQHPGKKLKAKRNSYACGYARNR